MNARRVVGWLALSLALGACSSKAQKAEKAQKVETTKSAPARDAGAPASPADWRILAPFIPERIAEFEQREEIDGKFTTVAEMPVSKVVRRYEAGAKTLFITITDAIGAPVMREPFANALTLDHEALHGYQKGKRIGDHTALVVWEANLRRSEVSMLVGDRFILRVDVRQASTDDEAEKLIVLLDIDGLARLKRSAK